MAQIRRFDVVHAAIAFLRFKALTAPAPCPLPKPKEINSAKLMNKNGLDDLQFICLDGKHPMLFILPLACHGPRSYLSLKPPANSPYFRPKRPTLICKNVPSDSLCIPEATSLLLIIRGTLALICEHVQSNNLYILEATMPTVCCSSLDPKRLALARKHVPSDDLRIPEATRPAAYRSSFEPKWLAWNRCVLWDELLCL